MFDYTHKRIKNSEDFCTLSSSWKQAEGWMPQWRVRWQRRSGRCSSSLRHLSSVNLLLPPQPRNWRPRCSGPARWHHTDTWQLTRFHIHTHVRTHTHTRARACKYLVCENVECGATGILTGASRRHRPRTCARICLRLASVARCRDRVVHQCFNFLANQSLLYHEYHAESSQIYGLHAKVKIMYCIIWIRSCTC